MPVYWVNEGFLKEGKVGEYRKWLSSAKTKALLAKATKETGVKFVGTFSTVLGFGDHGVEEWWELPNYAAFDKFRDSKTFEAIALEAFGLYDSSKMGKAKLLRSADDVKIMEPPKKKEK